MTDPAVEAAKRAWLNRPAGFESPTSMSEKLPYGRDMIAAAREALKPIRELHVKSDMYNTPVCVEDGYDWPCDTAKLIYPESEL